MPADIDVMTTRRHDPERLFDLDLVRCTENGALAAWKWIGKGNKNAADQAASDAIRGMFNLIDCQGVVRIGEGLKDEAPGIFMGEKLGSWNPTSPPVAIAVDPIDGTTPLAKGLNGSISVLAVATSDDTGQDPQDLFPNVPSHYMEKLAVGPRVKSSGATVSIDAPLVHNLKAIAQALDKRVSDLAAVVLDRPRHEQTIRSLRESGCGIRLIPDGDVAAAIAPCLPNSGVDLYVGIGGSPEAVLAASAIKCLGGELLCRMFPKDDQEKRRLDGGPRLPTSRFQENLVGRGDGQRRSHHLRRHGHQRFAYASWDPLRKPSLRHRIDSRPCKTPHASPHRGPS